MSLLRNRNFSLLFFGQLVSTFGDNLYSLALPWFVYQLTNSKTDLALSGIAVYLPAIAGLFVGVYVDRWRKQWIMIGADAVRLLIAVLMFLIVLVMPDVWLLFGLVLLIQLVGTVFQPAQSAMIPLIVERNDIPTASGLNQSGVATTRLVSNLSGGLMMTFLGAAALFLLDAASFLVSIVTLLLLKVSEPRPKLDSQRAKFLYEWRAGFRYIRSQRAVLCVVITTVFANFALIPTEIVLVAWVKGPLHGQADVLGVTMAAISVGMVVGGIAVKRLARLLSVRILLILGLASTGLCIALIGVDASQWYAMVMLLVVGFDIGVMNGAIGSFYLLAIDEAYRGRTLSTLKALASLAAPVGTALYGFLMTQMNLRWVFLVLGVPIVISGIIMLTAGKARALPPPAASLSS